MERHLRWGVLGAAGIARMAVVPAIARSRNGKLAAVATRSPASAAAWAKEVGFHTVHASYEALLADESVDAVYIPLPNSYHVEWTLKAAAAGKAVLCEKPLALNADDAARLVSECRRLGTPLLEGFMYRFHPQHARVREILRSGAIGEVVEVQAHLSVDLMSPADPENVRFDPKLGGGCILDMGCYVASIPRFLLEEEPVDVIGRWQIDPAFGVDVSASALFGFGSGISATVSCSFRGNGQGYYRVVGRKGLIDVPRGIIPGLGDRASETIIYVVDENGERREERLAPVDQYQLMVEAFADSILGGGPLPTSADDAVRNLRALDAWTRSAKTCQPIAIPQG